MPDMDDVNDREMRRREAQITGSTPDNPVPTIEDDRWFKERKKKKKKNITKEKNEKRRKEKI